MKRATPRQQKIAAVYDTDIWPLVPARAADSILRALPRRPATIAFEAGCGTGRLAFAVAERLDDSSRILALDASPAFIERAEAAKAGQPASEKVSFHNVDLVPPLPIDDAAYHLALSNLSLGDAPDPQAAVADLARCLKPGGQLLATVPLRGCWDEFLDLYGDVLTEQGKVDVLRGLAAHRQALPDAESAAGWLEAAGLVDVTVEVTRWELLFKSAREFFFAPIVEMGPLPTWKQIAGGHGDEMQDVFFFVKEAIEAYYSGTVFAVSMVIGCLKGTHPNKARRR
ncbi:MAG: class I SAM-dependent methyltransferase [Pseudomonadota bacterium]